MSLDSPWAAFSDFKSITWRSFGIIAVVSAGLCVLTACSGILTPLPPDDAGVDDAGSITPEPFYVCDGPDDAFPQTVDTVELLEAFAQSGCSTIDGDLVYAPALVERPELVENLREILGRLKLRGGYRNASTLRELRRVERIGGIILDNAAGVRSLDGLQAVEALPLGLTVRLSTSFVDVGMSNLRSIGDTERLSLEGGLQIVDTRRFVDLAVAEDFALLTGPLKLRNLPLMNFFASGKLLDRYENLDDNVKVEEAFEYCDVGENGPA